MAQIKIIEGKTIKLQELGTNNGKATSDENVKNLAGSEENNINNENTLNSENTTNNGTDASQNNDKKQTMQETEIAKFTTKIYSKDSARQNNVKITCNTLNGTTVENGATFSFCNTVGQATTAKGYQKAEIFDNKRK